MQTYKFKNQFAEILASPRKKTVVSVPVNVRWWEGNLFKDDSITCFCENKNKQSQETEIEKTIYTDDFIKWLAHNDKLSHCEDYNDPRQSDGHGQKCGDLTWEEYCGLSANVIMNDLSKFLSK